ncbi:MAG: helix-turn-helix domain-containing protein [Oscillospiraceae bacterium]|nr:helix-turn-helix domain-containing protein [Oscillospiraceae bacterium]
MSVLGANIAARRIACKFKQLELAERVKVSPAMISFIESGRKTPSIALLAEIADALDTSMPSLFQYSQPVGCIGIKPVQI